MRKTLGFIGFAGLALVFAAVAAPNQLRAEESASVTALAAQIEALKSEYEARIRALEDQLSTLTAKAEARAAAPETPPATPAYSRATADNDFNPAIGVVLNGLFADHSGDAAAIPGLPFGHEGERAGKGLSLGHSELGFTGNIDDKFRGALTLGFAEHGSETELEIEEAYLATLPGTGLPEGFRIKAGRGLWTIGYLNEIHRHADDFVDRPLPYRTFLDGAYNDDGIEAAFVFPTPFYSEIGAGLFRGADTPFGGTEDGQEAWSAYARLGGDLGRDIAWRVGGYLLDGRSHERAGGGDDAHAHGDEDEDSDGDGDGEEEEGPEHFAELFAGGAFTGDTRLLGADVRVTWAPTGNPGDGELILQGEYFQREESGLYALPDEEDGTEGESDTLVADSSGWYAQAIYGVQPGLRAGVRYAQMNPPKVVEASRTPTAVAVMADWSNSEYSRARLQYNRETLAPGHSDDQLLLQYIISLGAHPAHSF